MKTLGTLLILSGLGTLAYKFLKELLEKRNSTQRAAGSSWAPEEETVESRYVVTRITMNFGSDATDLLGLCNSVKGLNSPSAEARRILSGCCYAV